MKRYLDVEIAKIRELRKQSGQSYVVLQRITGIPASTIRNWCCDDLQARSKTLLIAHEQKRQALRLSEQAVFDTIEELSASQAKIYAALLYACEGSKYPAHAGIAFVNSEPSLVNLFVTLLRKAFVLDESKWRVYLQMHNTQQFADLKKYWCELLDISETQFIKPTVTQLKGGKHRRVYQGTCTVRYIDYRIQLKLMGIYEQFARKFAGKL